MSLEGINVGEYGKPVELTAKDKDGGSVLDLSAYTTLSAKLQTPGGDTITRSASFTNDGSDGLVRFTPQEGDFSEEGEHSLQLITEVGSVVSKSGVVEFYVDHSL